MAIAAVLKEPNDILHTKCAQIDEITDEIKQLTKDLLDTARAAKNPEAAGLAAPQINVLKRMCVVRRFSRDKGDPEIIRVKDYVLINPELLKTSKELSGMWEGCLSIPQKYAYVERADKVKVKAMDENGKEVKINASGFFAKVIQHEIDHLDGILMTERTKEPILTEEEFEKLQKVVE